jgi:hypothetical protein
VAANSPKKTFAVDATGRCNSWFWPAHEPSCEAGVLASASLKSQRPVPCFPSCFARTPRFRNVQSPSRRDFGWSCSKPAR